MTCSAGSPGSRTRRGPPRRSAAVNWPRVTDLASRCDEAQKRAAQAAAVQSAQAQARQAAGRLVTDTKSYLVDVRVADALISGLRQPRIKVMSVACIVRGDLAMANHAG